MEIFLYPYSSLNDCLFSFALVQTIKDIIQLYFLVLAIAFASDALNIWLPSLSTVVKL